MQVNTGSIADRKKREQAAAIDRQRKIARSKAAERVYRDVYTNGEPPQDTSDDMTTQEKLDSISRLRQILLSDVARFLDKAEVERFSKLPQMQYINFLRIAVKIFPYLVNQYFSKRRLITSDEMMAVIEDSVNNILESEAEREAAAQERANMMADVGDAEEADNFWAADQPQEDDMPIPNPFPPSGSLFYDNMYDGPNIDDIENPMIKKPTPSRAKSHTAKPIANKTPTPPRSMSTDADIVAQTPPTSRSKSAPPSSAEKTPGSFPSIGEDSEAEFDEPAAGGKAGGKKTAKPFKPYLPDIDIDSITKNQEANDKFEAAFKSQGSQFRMIMEYSVYKHGRFDPELYDQDKREIDEVVDRRKKLRGLVPGDKKNKYTIIQFYREACVTYSKKIWFERMRNRVVSSASESAALSSSSSSSAFAPPKKKTPARTSPRASSRSSSRASAPTIGHGFVDEDGADNEEVTTPKKELPGLNKKRFYVIGSICVNRRILDTDREMSVRNLSLSQVQQFPKKAVSDDLAEVVALIADHGSLPKKLYSALSVEEQDYLRTLLDRGRLLDQYVDVVGEPKRRIRKGHLTVLETNRAMAERFAILKGEVISGNDNPQLKIELKSLVGKMHRAGMISEQDWWAIVSLL